MAGRKTAWVVGWVEGWVAGWVDGDGGWADNFCLLRFKYNLTGQAIAALFEPGLEDVAF